MFCKVFLIFIFSEGYICDNRAVIHLSLENETYFGKLYAIGWQGRGGWRGRTVMRGDCF